MGMSASTNPVDLLEQTFDLYSQYLELTEPSILGQVVPAEPEFYAPPPSAQGLVIY